MISWCDFFFLGPILMSIFLIRSKFQYFSYMLDGHFYTSFVNTVHVFPSIFLFIRMFLFLKDAADIQR